MVSRREDLPKMVTFKYSDINEEEGSARYLGKERSIQAEGTARVQIL